MISAVILAAGMSQRMKEAKLFLPFKKHTIIEEVIDNAKSSKVDEIYIVHGDDVDRWRRIANTKGVVPIYNSNYKKGQSTSVKAGMERISRSTDGVLFLLGDQPFIKSNIINEIIDKFHRTDRASIIVPRYERKRGNPVLFHLKWKNDLLSLIGDQGARSIFIKNNDEVSYIDFDNKFYNLDIDTKEDYRDAIKVEKKVSK
ncbi:molybdenum cofactor cytidylyltransferase [Lutibacter sp. B2]|nr:molybdenum cofactor cytidylyltransferase [Lutibacter sp. B2]